MSMPHQRSATAKLERVAPRAAGEVENPLVALRLEDLQAPVDFGGRASVQAMSALAASNAVTYQSCGISQKVGSSRLP